MLGIVDSIRLPNKVSFTRFEYPSRLPAVVQERMAVSAVIQDARIASGGRRVNLSREMEVLGRYREALGKPGTSLAMTLLELCRGRI